MEKEDLIRAAEKYAAIIEGETLIVFTCPTGGRCALTANGYCRQCREYRSAPRSLAESATEYNHYWMGESRASLMYDRCEILADTCPLVRIVVDGGEFVQVVAYGPGGPIERHAADKIGLADWCYADAGERDD